MPVVEDEAKHGGNHACSSNEVDISTMLLTDHRVLQWPHAALKQHGSDKVDAMWCIT